MFAFHVWSPCGQTNRKNFEKFCFLQTSVRRTSLTTKNYKRPVINDDLTAVDIKTVAWNVSAENGSSWDVDPVTQLMADLEPTVVKAATASGASDEAKASKFSMLDSGGDEDGGWGDDDW